MYQAEDDQYSIVEFYKNYITNNSNNNSDYANIKLDLAKLIISLKEVNNYNYETVIDNLRFLFVAIETKLQNIEFSAYDKICRSYLRSLNLDKDKIISNCNIDITDSILNEFNLLKLN